MSSYRYIRWLDEVGIGDIAEVGGKNASLGEMQRALIDQGVRVPPGFATSAEAYWGFLEHNGLRGDINDALARFDVEDVAALAATAERVRSWIENSDLPPELADEIRCAYQALSEADPLGGDVAVRSSATAEDLPDASFAGQQETFLHIRGEARLLGICRRVLASLFTARAIAYRAHRGFEHIKLRSPSACSGWCAPTSGPPASCSRSTPSPASATW